MIGRHKRRGEARQTMSTVRMSERRLSAAIAVLFCVGPLAAHLAQAREFRAADIQEESYPTVQALRLIDQLVTKRTDRRHSIRVFHSRQLGEESQTIAQTRVGAIDINRINVAAIGNAVPVLNVLALPFLFRSIDHLYKVIDGPIGDDILAAVEPHGFIGLAFYDSGIRSIYTARRPVRTIEDLRGLRIRIQQSDLMSKMVSALGAKPVGLPYGQIATALTANLVDGAENNWPSYVSGLRRPLQGGALLHHHRAFDGAGDRDHVAARLGRAVAGGPYHLP
jgi:TRAP-type C4-dicarboxylate transport system substrate-binding protein